MKKEEALQTVTLFDGLADPFFDLILVQRSVLVVPTGPIVASARLVADTLSALENILQFSVQNLVIDNPRFHINDYRARFQISNHRTRL